MKQISLFEPVVEPELPKKKRDKIGQTAVTYKDASDILTRASGFMDSYDYTLNPYSGCSFGCTYCYAAFFAREKEKQDNWGYWVEVKQNGLDKLRRKRKTTLANKVIYMSSVTDPYQPIEKDLELTRDLLKELINYSPLTLYVQTRSPLVTRDIDLYQELAKRGRVQVNMTVTTDSPAVKHAFEPYCPSNKRRIQAITEIHEAGIDSCITMTPLLPLDNPEQFAEELADTGISRFIIQPFHAKRGRFVAGTRDAALQVLEHSKWDETKHEKIVKIIEEKILSINGQATIGRGKDGFSYKG